MAALGLVVVDSDLRSELDLLDLDLQLVLASELGLLLLLVAVLPVVHHLGDRRIGLRRHLDQVEVLRIRVLERLGRVRDPDLAALLVDQTHTRYADRLVDPGLRDRADRLDEPPRSQRPFTKLLRPLSRTTKPLLSSGPKLLVFRLG